ncbi:hypothetical protein IFR05_008177, partial [Cadophora sp. M221]
HSTTTALCSLPTPSQRCSIPGLGYSQNLISFAPNLSGIECHELCLRDAECRSFQLVPQDNGFLKYTRCNLYRTSVDGHVSETGDGDAVFWDRGCWELLAPGCAKKIQTQKRDQVDSKCCRLQRLPVVRPDKTMDGEENDQNDAPDLDSGDEGLPLSVDEGIRVERDEILDSVAEDLIPSTEDEGIRVERDESPDAVVGDVQPIDVDNGIRVERDESPDSVVEDVSLLVDDEGIRVERDEIPDAVVEDISLLADDEGIRVEREESSAVVLENTLPLESGEEIRVERNETPDHTMEDAIPIDADQGIRVERDKAILPSPIDSTIRVSKPLSNLQPRTEITYKLPLANEETPDQAARNGYKLSHLNNDEEIRPMRREKERRINSPSRKFSRSAKLYKIPVPDAEELEIHLSPQKVKAPGPGKRNSPSRPARTPSPRIPSWYKIPIPEGDETYKLPTPEGEDTYRLPEPEPQPDSKTIRPEKREDGPIDPMITPAPDLPAFRGEKGLSVLENDVDVELDKGKGIRVEKRAVWTTPDFLTTFFPLFITLAYDVDEE